MGVNPAYYRAGLVLSEDVSPQHPNLEVTDRHPVEFVDLIQSSEFVTRIGLSLPSAAPWEFACRAATTTDWIWGDEDTDLEGRANIADASAREFVQASNAPWDDGYPIHAPVGSYPPNGFGLYDMDGNVSEWTTTWWPDDFLGHQQRRVFRGGSFVLPPYQCESHRQMRDRPANRLFQRGLRAFADAEVSER
jgi:formylglycine-generating enzyme required for sulfatase activity